MEPVVLRHRAYCRSCRSKLPPRANAWRDPETDEVTCPTCHRLEEVVPSDARPTAGADQVVSAPFWESAPLEPVDRGDREGASDLGPQVVDHLRALGARPGPGMPGYTPPTGPPPGRPRRADVAPPPGAPVPDVTAASAPGAAAAPGSTGAGSPVDPGAERNTATLDAAVDQGLITLHRRRVPGSTDTLDHLVVAPNGLWVVRDLPSPEGKVERRDLGDWFSSDPRLFVADQDRSDLVHRVHTLVEGVGAALVDTPVAALPRRGVLCFVDAPVGWFANPFILEEVSITWRTKLVEPMVSSVLYGPPVRAELAAYLDTVFPAA